MNLDETWEALQSFQLELRAFNDRLRSDRAELQLRHDEIDPLWQDKLRRDYDLAIQELDAQVKAYTGARSQRLEEFMEIKIAQLRSYLHGD